MKHLTDRELIELIDRGLKQAAEDVRLGRVPLDGRVRFLAPDAPEVKTKNPNADD